jgi:ATP-dependent protease HslVU (ClpYQ) peptidase subunit
MTAIVAIKTSSRVVMGCDSAAIGGWHLQLRADPKVFRVGQFLLGCCGSIRMAQLLQFGEGRLSLRSLRPRGDSLTFMVRHFVPKMRAILKKGGYAKVLNNVEETGEFLIAWRNHLFTIHADMQVAQLHDHYAACGCAWEIALGSLFSTHGRAEERIALALEAAEHCSAGVRRPFVIEST